MKGFQRTAFQDNAFQIIIWHIQTDTSAAWSAQTNDSSLWSVQANQTPSWAIQANQPGDEP